MPEMSWPAGHKIGGWIFQLIRMATAFAGICKEFQHAEAGERSCGWSPNPHGFDVTSLSKMAAEMLDQRNISTA